MTPTPTLTPTLKPHQRGPENVLAGWLGIPVPPLPRQRNKTRAGYRKTNIKRSPAEATRLAA